MRSLRLIFPVGFCLAALAFLLPACSRPREAAPDLQGNRIVSLAPSLTEIVCAVGAATQLVGRTTACDYPPEIIPSVPVVGGFGAPALDLLLKLRPTLVLEVDLADAAIGKAIDETGLARRRIACSTVDEIPRAILQVGRLTGCDDQARSLAETIAARVAELRGTAQRRLASDRPGPAVFVEIWGDPLTTVGKKSFLSDLVSLAGGRNLGDEAADKDYFTVSAEWVIARNPDVIICLYMSKPGKTEGKRSEIRDQRSAINHQPSSPSHPPSTIHHPPSSSDWARIASRTGWAGVAAVKHHRVYGSLNDSPIMRPGPRILEGIEELRRCIE